MEYWEKRYQEGKTGWDIGYATPALCRYFDQVEDKNKRILIPGAGHAYEAAYLHAQGFKNIFVLDLAPSPLENFQKKNPSFPSNHLIRGDFFEHSDTYDYILEQTFFCAIDPSFRKQYAHKANELLNTKGKLIGLLWSVEMNTDQPPYGGNKEEYKQYFDQYFSYRYFEKAKDSIPERAGREYFILAEKMSKQSLKFD